MSCWKGLSTSFLLKLHNNFYMEPFAKGLDSFMNQPVLCPFMNRYQIAQCKETWLDNTYKGMGSEHVGRYIYNPYIMKSRQRPYEIDDGLAGRPMGLQDCWRFSEIDHSLWQSILALSDCWWPSAVAFGLVRLLMTFGDLFLAIGNLFWPCQTLAVLRRSFLASGDLFWPSNISSGLCRSFLALYDVLAVLHF